MVSNIIIGAIYFALGNIYFQIQANVIFWFDMF